ncbi:protein TRIGALACTOSYLDIACYLGLYCEROL 3, chloroplastic isoform X2, partial [Fagus crenata]
MVLLLGSALFPLSIPNGASRSASVAFSGGRRINSFCYKQWKEQRKVVCACVASPQNLRSDESSATKFNRIDTDMARSIDTRDVYKSFGEKHILRGVSFK